MDIIFWVAKVFYKLGLLIYLGVLIYLEQIIAPWIKELSPPIELEVSFPILLFLVQIAYQVISPTRKRLKLFFWICALTGLLISFVFTVNLAIMLADATETGTLLWSILIVWICSVIFTAIGIINERINERIVGRPGTNNADYL